MGVWFLRAISENFDFEGIGTYFDAGDRNLRSVLRLTLATKIYFGSYESFIRYATPQLKFGLK